MPEKSAALIALCIVLISAGVLCSSEKADDEATKLLDLANALYSRGPAYYGQAVIQYREFLRRYPADERDERCEEATFFLANCLRKLGKNEEALQYFLDHEKFKGSPRRDEANLRTGQVYFSLGKYAEAIRYLLRVYEKKVEGDLASSCAFWLGWSYLRNNRAKEAVPVLAKLANGKDNPLVPWANFRLGYAYRATGDAEKSIERFQKAAATLPERKDEALFMVAEAYAKLQKYHSAYGAYKELVEKHPKSSFHGRAAFGAVWSLYSEKDYDNAIKAYEVCRNFIPQDSQAEATYILGNCYLETKKPDEALQTYRKVSRDFPKSPFAENADYKACWCLFLQDKFDELLLSGTSFLKKYPSNVEIANIHFLVGESLYKRNRVEEALSQYITVVGRFPKCPFREEASFKLGLCYLSTGQHEKARKALRDLVSTYPGSKWAPEALARSAEAGLELARKAKPELQQAQYQEVAGDYRALVEKYPKDGLAQEALYQLGITYYARLNRRDEMVKAFERLVKDYAQSQNCAEAYYWLASEREEAKEYERAIDYFERSLKLKPKGSYSELARRRLADVYYKKGEKQKAASLILEALKSNPQSEVPEQTHLWAGDFLLENGQYDQAAEAYDLFLKKFRTSPRREGAYYGLGDSYFKQGKWQQAIENFTKAIELNGQLVSLSRLQSGIAHLKLARNKAAEELLREVRQSRVLELETKASYWLGNMHFDLAQKMKTGKERIEQYNLARAEYIRVVIFDTENRSEARPECMYRVAECLEQEGLAEDAKKELGNLIKEYPDNEFAQKARERLGIAPPR